MTVVLNISKLRERLALCKADVRERPFSAPVTTGWYADDVEALLEAVQLIPDPGADALEDGDGWDVADVLSRELAETKRNLLKQIIDLGKERDDALEAAQRNWDEHGDRVAKLIDAEREGMRALRDQVEDLAHVANLFKGQRDQLAERLEAALARKICGKDYGDTCEDCVDSCEQPMPWRDRRST